MTEGKDTLSPSQLASEWLRAEEEIERLNRELTWYANAANWSQAEFVDGKVTTPAEADKGKRARAALYGEDDLA